MTVRRILMTTDTVGGVWTYAVDLAQALSAVAIETVLVTMGPAPTEAQRGMIADVGGVTLVESGAELDWLAPDAATIALAGRNIAAIARDHDIDLVHLNTPALAADTDFGVPVVAVAHSCLASWWEAVETGPLPRSFAWRDALTRAGMIAADVVVAPSHAFAAATARIHRLPALPTAVHNGRTPMVSDPQPQDHHAFTAGRLWDRGKNLKTLDQAAKSVRIAAAGPQTGPGGERVDVDHIECLGTLDATALGRRLAAKPVFVSAALYEPFGLAVLEAAQAGCALVLSDVPTFRELWDGAALFVAPHDADGFAAAIGRLCADPTERARLGATAAAAAERFTVTAMRDGMAAVYASIAWSSDRRVAA